MNNNLVEKNQHILINKTVDGCFLTLENNKLINDHNSEAMQMIKKDLCNNLMRNCIPYLKDKNKSEHDLYKINDKVNSLTVNIDLLHKDVKIFKDHINSVVSYGALFIAMICAFTITVFKYLT